MHAASAFRHACKLPTCLKTHGGRFCLFIFKLHSIPNSQQRPFLSMLTILNAISRDLHTYIYMVVLNAVMNATSPKIQNKISLVRGSEKQPSSENMIHISKPLLVAKQDWKHRMNHMLPVLLCDTFKLLMQVSSLSLASGWGMK